MNAKCWILWIAPIILNYLLVQTWLQSHFFTGKTENVPPVVQLGPKFRLNLNLEFLHNLAEVSVFDSSNSIMCLSFIIFIFLWKGKHLHPI